MAEINSIQPPECEDFQTKQENMDEITTSNPNTVLPDNFGENIISQQATIYDSSDPLNEDIESWKDIQIGQHIPENIREMYATFFKENQDIISRHKYDIGKTDLVRHHIQLTKIPERQRQRFLPQDKLKFAIEACEKLHRAGIIKPSKAPITCSNLVLVPKFISTRQNTKADILIARHQKSQVVNYRLAQDMRNLNNCTKNTASLISLTPDALVNKLASSLVSSFDLRWAYYHVELSEPSKELTSFHVGQKVYCWTRMTMGLVSSGNSWDELMFLATSDDVLEKIKKQLTPEELKVAPRKFSDIFSHYFDDTYTFSCEDHFKHYVAVKITLLAFKLAGLKISAKKSRIATKTVKVLGHELDTFSREQFLDESKANSILSWPRPSSLYELQSRLYSLIYWQKYLPGLKQVSFPLQQLLRSNNFKWEHVHENAWNRIKTLIRLDIHLNIPSENEQLFLFCDSSKISCSQVLFSQSKNDFKVVGTNSKLFSYQDSSKNIHAKEMISVVLGLQHFQGYIMASKQPLVVFTDAKSLLYLGRCKDFDVVSANLSSYLTYYAARKNYTIVHLSGKVNFLADLFSRAYARSRFINKSVYPLSKQHAKNLPPLTEPFSADSELIYKYLISERLPESNDLYDRKRPSEQIARPLKQLFEKYKNISPEEKFSSAVRLLQQFNDKSISNLCLEQKLVNDKKSIKDLVAKVKTIPLTNKEKKIKSKEKLSAQKLEDYLKYQAKKHPENSQEMEKISYLMFQPPDVIFKHMAKIQHFQAKEDMKKENTVFYTPDLVIKKQVVLSPIAFNVEKNQMKYVTQGHIFSNSPLKLEAYGKDLKVILMNDIKTPSCQHIFIKNEGENTIRIQQHQPFLKIDQKKQLVKIQVEKVPFYLHEGIFLPNVPIRLQLQNKSTQENDSVFYNTDSLEKLTNEKKLREMTNHFSKIAQLNNLEQISFLNQKSILDDYVDRQLFSRIQSNCPVLGSIYNRCKNEESKTFNRYVIEKEILYKEFPTGFKICMPEILVEAVVQYIHKRYMHNSKQQIKDIFEQNYFYPKANQIIANVKAKCYICSVTNIHPKYNFEIGKTRSFVPTRPFEAISVDTITGLPKTSSNCTAFLLIQDLFSKYLTAIPMLNHTAVSVKNAFCTYLMQNGLPYTVYSDSEQSLIKVISEYANIFNFKYISSSPQSQHQNTVESAFKQLKKKITKIIYDPDSGLQRADWMTAVIVALQNFNNETIGRLPYTKSQVHFNKVDTFLPFSYAKKSYVQTTLFDEVKDYHKKTKEKSSYKGKNIPQFYIGEIVIRKIHTQPVGINSAFLLRTSTPLKVQKILNDGYTIQVAELEGNKIFFLHPQDLVKIPSHVELELNKNWDKNLFIKAMRSSPHFDIFPPKSKEKTPHTIDEEIKNEDATKNYEQKNPIANDKINTSNSSYDSTTFLEDISLNDDIFQNVQDTNDNTKTKNVTVNNKEDKSSSKNGQKPKAKCIKVNFDDNVNLIDDLNKSSKVKQKKTLKYSVNSIKHRFRLPTIFEHFIFKSKK